MVCPSCYTTKFRLSQFRPADITHLLTTRYPVRCRTCGHRMYSGPLYAFHLWQERRRKRHPIQGASRAG